MPKRTSAGSRKIVRSTEGANSPTKGAFGDPTGTHRRPYASAGGMLSVSNWRRFASNRFWFLLIAGIFAFGIIAYFGTGTPSMNREREARSNEPVATVNGEPITRGEFESIWNTWQRSGMGSDEANAPLMQGMILNQLIDVALMRAAAKQRKVQVSDADIEKEITDRKAQLGQGGKPITDEELLKLSGAKSKDDLRESLRGSLLPRALGKSLANVNALTENDLQASYDEVKVRHILVAVDTSPRPSAKALPEAQAKRKAEEILAKVKAGGDFAKLANEFTDDPSNAPQKFDPKEKKMVPDGAPKGGDLGWYRRGGGFAKEFEDAAFALGPGQVSDLVRTPFGFHIIKVEEKRRNLPPDYATTKGKLLDDLKNQRAGEALQKFLEEQRKSAQVVWKDPGMEWRYLYVKSSPMGMMGQPSGDMKKMETELIAKLRAYLPNHPEDTAANLVLGRLLYQQYMMASLPMGGPGNKPADPAEREKLRNEVIQYYEAALRRAEDREVRFTLARLYQEKKDTSRALEQYQMIGKFLFDQQDQQALTTRQRLKQGFTELGRKDLADAETAKIAEIQVKLDAEKKAEAERQAKEKAEQERLAKEKAEREKAAQQQQPPTSNANTPPPPGSSAPPAPGATAPGATPPPAPGGNR